MTTELITVISVGIALGGLFLTCAGLIVTLLIRFEKRVERRMDQQEERFNRRMDQQDEQTSLMEGRLTQRIDHLEREMNQQYGALDTRLRTVEENQARLSGEMSTLREAILLRPAGRE